MKSALRWLLLPAMALALASCAGTYDNYYATPGYGYYGDYADYAAPDYFYPPAYGGIVFGDGWRSHWGGHDHWNGHAGYHGFTHAGFNHAHGLSGAWHGGGMRAHGGHAGARHG
jgi:hypothetical protein